MMREVDNPARAARAAAQRELIARRPGAWDKVGQILDRAVSAVAPERGRRRQVARLQAAALARYAGADRGRLHEGWIVKGASADDDLTFSGDRDLMRDRSRELVRSDPHAASIIRVLEDNVVGTGIRPQSRARPEDTGLTEAQAAEWNEAADALFDEVAASAQLDATGACNFWALQRLIYRSAKIDGDVFLHPIVVAGEPRRTLGTAVELIEAERVASPDGDEDRIRGGVEIGGRGQATAYWVRKGHPGDQFSNARAEEYQRVRRFRDRRVNMIHVYRRDRPGQTRGAPFLAPALSIFQHLRKYFEYELIAARTNASIALFITQGDLGDTPQIEWDADEGKYLEGIEAGGMQRLSPGEDIKSFNPNRPGTTFDPYIVRNLRAIGAAVGLPYELFARDASRVNYTSSRTLLLEAYRGFRCEQDWLVAAALQPIRELVLIEGYATGRLPAVADFADPSVRAGLLRAVWIPPARGWVDPVKEIQSSADAIRNNLSTHADEAAGNGRDFEETARMNAKHLRRLYDLEEEFQLPSGSLSGGLAGAAPAAPPAEEEEEVPEEEPAPGEPERETVTEEVESV